MHRENVVTDAGEKVSASAAQPEPHEVCRLWLEDGRTIAGVWTGREWWGEGHAVIPTHWQLLRPRRLSTPAP